MNAIVRAIDKKLGKLPTSTPSQPLWDESRRMHAIIWNGKKDMQYVEKPVPMITDSTDIVLRVTATTICGSDLHLYTNAFPDMKQGDIIGHEFMGIVEEVGSDVQRIQRGQRVVVAFDIACGQCEYCQRQEFTACDTTNPSKLNEAMMGHKGAALYGYSHMTGGVPGGQAEFVRVPFADVNCLVVPEGVPDEKALYLSDIIPTAYHGVELADVKPGSTVGIWGLGPVGLLAARWAQLRGATTIIGIDKVPERLSLARQLGIHVIDFANQKVLDTIEQLVPGGLDCTIECAGFEYATTLIHKVERALNLETDTADILTEMFMATRKCGNVSIIGVYVGFANHFPIGTMMEKGLNVRGGQSPTQKYWNMCLEKIQSGEMDPTWLVTTHGKLSDAPSLYKKFHEKSEGVVKVFLRPDQYQAL
eukprot:TRINITY_DN4314_c0_g1_i1.p1 TRINITY_DN4314_c0_g1~~TRINITY_DN4314_c0_g1_i1.p1  ORF type:complete len:419 (-),score=121.70 TRINITY_DN4314_c0_g1_i1:31-1287(-)